jgi:hypothetical protein
MLSIFDVVLFAIASKDCVERMGRMTTVRGNVM